MAHLNPAVTRAAQIRKTDEFLDEHAVEVKKVENTRGCDWRAEQKLNKDYSDEIHLGNLAILSATISPSLTTFVIMAYFERPPKEQFAPVCLLCGRWKYQDVRDMW